MIKHLLFFLLINLPILGYSQESFDRFLNKFACDSIYQEAHILFPYQKVVLNDEDYTYDTLIIHEANHQYISYFPSEVTSFEAFPVVYDNFEMKESSSKSRVFRWKGFYGMDDRYYFQQVEGEWYLIKIEELGD